MTEDSELEVASPQIERAIYDDSDKCSMLVRESETIIDQHVSNMMADMYLDMDINQSTSEDTDEPLRQTAASSWHMCYEAQKIVKSLTNFMDEYKMETHIFELVLPHWQFSPEELEKVDPRQLISDLQIWFDPSGIEDNGGWALGFLHGGFDPLRRTFPLTLKGICNARMAQVIEVLGRLGNLAADGERSCARLIPRAQYNQPLFSLMQTRWPLRLQINADGGSRCFDDCAPIPDRYHAQSLLWLDRWSFTDLRFSVGLEIREQYLQRSHTSAFHTRTLGDALGADC